MNWTHLLLSCVKDKTCAGQTIWTSLSFPSMHSACPTCWRVGFGGMLPRLLLLPPAYRQKGSFLTFFNNGFCFRGGTSQDFLSLSWARAFKSCLYDLKSRKSNGQHARASIRDGTGPDFTGSGRARALGWITGSGSGFAKLGFRAQKSLATIFSLVQLLGIGPCRAWPKFGLGLFRAYVVRAQLWARAYGLGPRPVPALASIQKLTFIIEPWLNLFLY